MENNIENKKRYVNVSPIATLVFVGIMVVGYLTISAIPAVIVGFLTQSPELALVAFIFCVYLVVPFVMAMAGMAICVPLKRPA